MDHTPLKVLMTPAAEGNPYQRLLCRALGEYGIEADLERIGVRTLLRPGDLAHYDVVHLHWLHPFYHRRSRWVSRLAGWSLVRWARTLARKRGIPIVATVHNIEPHAGHCPRLDQWVAKQVYRSCRTLVFHSEEASSEFSRRFPECEASHAIIPHGLYPASLVPKPDKQAAREYFGIRHTGRCILYLGPARPQKGYDRVLDACPALTRAGYFVVMAGEDLPRTETESVLTLPYFLPEEELPVLLAAADAVVLPYRKCTTSGVATLALGAGLPLAVSDLPAFSALIDRGLAVACTFSDPDHLCTELETVCGLPDQPLFKQEVTAYRRGRSWQRIAEQTERVYRQCRSASGTCGPRQREESTR